ncbi:family 43 glycosylhydrolase [Bradyrhizobium monzae]|uniref:family 43 glycosylhydrolase n=1 Tax=Bradyrhizobium sp. Oc8 TaxID=2876780 RepID=UPI001F3D7D4D|nr:family 43 glycosylhydrolase [Bradyrhizobium sp. Oc8]
MRIVKRSILLSGLGLVAGLAGPSLAQDRRPAPIAIDARHNPIIADGSFYTADPAPIALADTLYVLTGRDEARRDQAGFAMHEWELLASTDPASGKWTLYPQFLRPDKLFAWASGGAAWAAQMVQGPDGLFYLYAPVEQRDCGDQDCMGIGVAVADHPLGPWHDWHPEGPIVSQRLPTANHIKNIDPTVFVDEDGAAYLYWGTFGQLRGARLGSDMKTVGEPVSVKTLTGFFEAPWLFKRKGTWYMVYAANNAGPDSPCTNAVYHACQAYGTAPTPLGPWTYRGVILDPVSSTTSHAGLIPFKGQWYMAYHTADAKLGGHFRRSVAIDRVEWDDSVQPAAIRKVVPTHAPADRTPTHNVARIAHPTAFNVPIPLQYRLAALNDGVIYPAPLPPDMWASWNGRGDVSHGWVQYRWDAPVTIDGVRLKFWGDQPPGAGVGIATPRAWHLEVGKGGRWRPLVTRGVPTTGTAQPVELRFGPVTTRCLRLVLEASTDGKSHAAFGIEEWEVLSPAKVVPPAVPPTAADLARCD